MPVHPLLTAMLVMDTLVLLLLTGAAACAFQVVLNWSPADTNHAQLRLQARQESWSLATSIAMWTYLASGLLLIAILTNILPGRVPGAMCGTGVLQACRPDGYRLLLLRFLGAAGLFCWQRLESLNRSAPLAPLTPVNARLLLALLPIVCLGYGATFQTLTGLDTTRPVDCCTALYDRIGPTAAADAPIAFSRQAALWLFGISSVGLSLLALVRCPPAKFKTSRWDPLLPMLAAAWLFSGAVALVRFWAPYHYEVLHHFCPWCLFLPEHNGIGFPLAFFFGLVAFEATALWALIRVSARYGHLLPADTALAVGSCRRIVMGVIGFVLLAAGPALWWRWHFGMWLNS
ncbi:MAG: hypothetical protein QNI89_00865 [Desulfobacterales bacterium]|nr:hypothetical protein [Desulfobacterales bacterium]MDJ0885811.1 hypothetical protein [Desulfobacterales bacterium]